MKVKNIMIAASAAMFVMSGVANAVTAISWTSQPTPVKVAVQRTASFLAGVTGANATVRIPAATGIVGLMTDDVIKVTIAGAKFNRANLASVGVAVVTASSGTLSATAGTLNTANTVLTLDKVPTPSATNTNVDIVVVGSSSGILDLTGVAKGTKVTFSVSVVRKLMGQLTTMYLSPASTTEVTIDDLLSAATVTANTGTITVASGFKTLSGTATSTTAQAVSFVTATGDATMGDATGTGLVTISGNMAGVTSIGNGAGTALTNACDATGAQKTVTAGSYFIDVAASKAYGCYNNTATIAAPGIAPLFTFDNTTAKATRAYTVGLGYKAGSADKLSSFAVPAQTVLMLTRNGSAFSVNAAGLLNKIKITDMSGSLGASTGGISVVGYTASGAVAAGTSPVIPVLTSNGTQAIQMATLIAAFPTAARFDFSVQSTQILASNIKKTATGVTVTTYRNAVGTTTTPGNGAL